MPQEVSVTDQAVKSKVYKLIDAAVVGEKTDRQIRESMEQWWKRIHPADRAVAQKHLLRVLQKSQASLNAIVRAFLECAECKLENGATHERLAKSQPSQETPMHSLGNY